MFLPLQHDGEKKHNWHLLPNKTLTFVSWGFLQWKLYFFNWYPSAQRGELFCWIIVLSAWTTVNITKLLRRWHVTTMTSISWCWNMRIGKAIKRLCACHTILVMLLSREQNELFFGFFYFYAGKQGRGRRTTTVGKGLKKEAATAASLSISIILMCCDSFFLIKLYKDCAQRAEIVISSTGFRTNWSKKYNPNTLHFCVANPGILKGIYL